jgi:hypothetical protein
MLTKLLIDQEEVIMDFLREHHMLFQATWIILKPKEWLKSNLFLKNSLLLLNFIHIEEVHGQISNTVILMSNNGKRRLIDFIQDILTFQV